MLDSKSKSMYDDYKDLKKLFNKEAPEFLKKIGYTGKEISDCINDIESENKKRDEIINKLIDDYGLEVYRSDFPVMTYIMKKNEVELLIGHDYSRWLWIKDPVLGWRETFDPLDNNCYGDLCNKIEEFTKTKKI